jgi:hypothetical protein
MIVRQFRPDGIEAFRVFLASCRDKPAKPIPLELLEDDRLTEVAKPGLEVEPRALATKADAARYLSSVLAPLPDAEVAENAGLWTWLTLFFFDDVCPPRNGRRTVKNDYHYIFEPKNPRHFYRHLLFISWRVVKVAPVHNRLFLSSSLSILDKVTTEVMKRLYVTRIPCAFEVLDRLYWNDARGKARAGIVGQEIRRGDLTHRFPLRIRQLEKTYDLLSLSAEQLLELLGDEFQESPRAAQLFSA